MHSNSLFEPTSVVVLPIPQDLKNVYTYIEPQSTKCSVCTLPYRRSRMGYNLGVAIDIIKLLHKRTYQNLSADVSGVCNPIGQNLILDGMVTRGEIAKLQRSSATFSHSYRRCTNCPKYKARIAQASLPTVPCCDI